MRMAACGGLLGLLLEVGVHTRLGRVSLGASPIDVRIKNEKKLNGGEHRA
jgi:hypothetical protein